MVLGRESYNDAVKPYLEAKGSNERNRIREAGLPQLLTYCGLDSLLEHKVAMKQMKQLGMKL